VCCAFSTFVFEFIVVYLSSIITYIYRFIFCLWLYYIVFVMAQTTTVRADKTQDMTWRICLIGASYSYIFHVVICTFTWHYCISVVICFHSSSSFDQSDRSTSIVHSLWHCSISFQNLSNDRHHVLLHDVSCFFVCLQFISTTTDRYFLLCYISVYLYITSLVILWPWTSQE